MKYDGLGQLRVDASRGHEYAWDGFGRLSEVRVIGGGLVARYRYDVFNRRVDSYVPGSPAGEDVRTRYLYDGWQVIEERAVETDPLDPQLELEHVRARYVHDGGLQAIAMDRDVASGGMRGRWALWFGGVGVDHRTRAV